MSTPTVDLSGLKCVAHRYFRLPENQGVASIPRVETDQNGQQISVRAIKLQTSPACSIVYRLDGQDPTVTDRPEGNGFTFSTSYERFDVLAIEGNIYDIRMFTPDYDIGVNVMYFA